jgi:hypothetical protein
MQHAQADRFGRAGRRWLAVLVCASLSVTLAAGQSPAAADSSAPPAAPERAIPRPDQLEPGVNTTPAASAPTPPAPDTPARGGGAPASAASAGSPSERSAGNTAPQGAVASHKAAAGPKAAARKGPDRLELEATEITGNRELPKVLYIVPWKRSDLGDLVGKPVNSLLDEVLQPLDRDVFRRENRYYDALKPDGGAAKTGTARGSASKP